MRLQYTPILYLRRDKIKKDGSIPIYIRFQRIDGVEPKFSFGISVQPDEWDENTHRPKEPTLRIIADKEVTRIELQILNALANGEKITKSLLKEFVEGHKPDNKSFYDYFNDYIAKQSRRDKLSSSTIQGYNTTYRALKEFRKQIKPSDINAQFIERFDKFLTKRGLARGKGEVKGSRYNRLKHVNTVIKDIHRQGIPIDNPFANGEFDIPKPAGNDVFLESDELQLMMNLANIVPLETRWFRVLMMYLFACTTGMRISDILELKWDNVNLDDDRMFVKKIAKKTKREFIAPIFESAAEILAMSVEDIENVDRKLKVFHTYSRTTINKTLKELAILAGINKNISFHSARRTCATLLAAENVSPVFIRNMLGHKSIEMTSSYIKTSETLAAIEAKKIDLFSAERISPNNLKGL